MSDKFGNSTIETFPMEYRISVTESRNNNGNYQYQFQLPARLVGEVGFKSPRIARTENAMINWYYYGIHDKVVLGPKNSEISTLEYIGSTTLSGVKNDDLDSNDVSGARVTIIKDIPDHIYDRLKRDTVVLRITYAERNEEMDNTLIAVYPRKEYDRGELANTWRKDEFGTSTDTSSNDREYKGGGVSGYADSYFG